MLGMNSVLRVSLRVILISVLFYVYVVSSQLFAKSGLVKEVNLQVVIIKKSIKESTFAMMKIEHKVESEVAPALMYFYYEENKKRTLRAVIVKVGHESWGTRFAYYFDSSGNILKYSKTIIGRPDKPAKLAIIYQKGKKIWSNTDQPYVSIQAIKTIFKNITQTSNQFQKY